MHRAEAVGARLRALPVLPTLAILVALQVALAFWFAFHTPHNGWIWYSGGDATEYWTEQWAVAHGIIPQAVIGPALPIYYAWVPLVAGPTLLNGAAVIVLFQAVVLVPLALVLFWLTADRLFGRVYAWAATGLWVAGPLLLLHGFVDRYHAPFDQYFLVPHWFGFTNMADLPSVVAVLASAWLLLRAVDLVSPTDAVLAGLFAGLALALKPSNGFFILAVAVLFIATRQARQAAFFAVALVPALLTLLLWKVRGLGVVPITSSSYEHARVAAGTSAPVAFASSKYGGFDWHHLQIELADLREVFWSLRFLEFLLVAGAFGVVRRRPSRGLFVAAWFASYGLLKGSNVQAGFNTTSWFRLAEPGLPAYILLATGVVFCLPGIGRRAAAAVAPAVHRVGRRAIAAMAVVAGAIPLLVVVIAQPASSMRLVRDNKAVNEAPLSSDFDLKASVGGGKVLLSWHRPAAGSTTPLFKVYVSAANDGCLRPEKGSVECQLQMDRFSPVAGTTFSTPRQRGTHWYRVGMVADYRRASGSGDLMLLSRSVRVP